MPALSLTDVQVTRKSTGGAFMNAIRTLADEALSGSETVDTVAQVLIGGNAWTTGERYTQSLTSNSGKVYGPNFTAAYVHREILARVQSKFPTLKASAHNRGPIGYIVPTPAES